MSDRSQWKMLHLLYVFGKPSLSLQTLEDAGIYCYNDTIQELVQGARSTKKSIRLRLSIYLRPRERFLALAWWQIGVGETMNFGSIIHVFLSSCRLAKPGPPMSSTK